MLKISRCEVKLTHLKRYRKGRCYKRLTVCLRWAGRNVTGKKSYKLKFWLWKVTRNVMLRYHKQLERKEGEERGMDDNKSINARNKYIKRKGLMQKRRNRRLRNMIELPETAEHLPSCPLSHSPLLLLFEGDVSRENSEFMAKRFFSSYESVSIKESSRKWSCLYYN